MRYDKNGAAKTHFAKLGFVQGEDALPYFALCIEKGEDSVITLMESERPEYPEVVKKLPKGAFDADYRSGDYVLTYNLSIGYIGLCQTVTADYDRNWR